MTAPFPVETLGPHHDRKAFSSGIAALDRYFHEQVGQDVRRRAAACYVAVDALSGSVAGYYTLAASGVPLPDMPEALAKRLPRYGLVPVARLGRLAVATPYRGRRIGAMLLWDAAFRAVRSGMGVLALVVDAKDETAASFYRHHGFVAFGSLPYQLLLSLSKLPISGEPLMSSEPL